MEKEIIFSDMYGHELFRIPDDSCIHVISFDGQRTTYPCKYVSAAETNIGGCIYEAGNFAQEQAEKGAVFAPSDQRPEDIGMYEIHQIRSKRQTDYAFRSFEEARNTFQPLDYTRVYAGMLAPDQLLEHLFSLHNAGERPFGRRMRSMSVSDVVVILKDGAANAHYVDSFGFAPVPRFLEPDTFPVSERNTISGYTVTVSVPMGNKAFVLAENPRAVQPFVTWQSSRDNKSCEWGHYYDRRTDAVRDLYRRVNQERDYQRDFPPEKERFGEVNDMELNIRAITPEEIKYSYSQSQQLRMQCGSIGHLRGDFGSKGYEFYTTWDEHNPRLKTEAFKSELDEVINALRSDEYGLLKDRYAMGEFKQRYPESAFTGNYTTEYGFRVDTQEHAYLLRCNPVRGDYNFYCFCYQAKWLDRNIEKAQQGIRFIDSGYKELFRVPDGGKIVVTAAWGEKMERACRYIDDTHVEVGKELYHICQFAEIMKKNGASYEPLEKNQPKNKDHER